MPSKPLVVTAAPDSGFAPASTAAPLVPAAAAAAAVAAAPAALVRRVVLVAKSHFDMGFTGLAADVVNRWIDEYLPAACAVGREFGQLTGERFTWTVGSFVLDEALRRGGSTAATVAAGVERGFLRWHALPFTMHSGLLDPPLVDAALALSHQLDARFGVRTRAAKQSDVPGHHVGLARGLARGGVEFLHVGVNPASSAPEVPAVFEWRASNPTDEPGPVVAYSVGGYGRPVQVGETVLTFLHAGDNLGPPQATEVIHELARWRQLYPEADVVLGTLEDVVDEAIALRANGDLAVVAAEIGDSWAHGLASDPPLLASFLAARREHVARPRTDLARELLQVAEHTHGLDQKTFLGDYVLYSGNEGKILQASPAGALMERSWSEQRTYLATHDFSRARVAPARAQGHVQGGAVLESGNGRVRAVVSEHSGGLARVWIDEAEIGPPLDTPLLVFETFGSADFGQFASLYNINEAQEGWWSRLDFTKPGIPLASGTAYEYSLYGSSLRPDPTKREGVDLPEGMASEVGLDWHADLDGLELRVAWPAREPTRMPHALWLCLAPVYLDLGQPWEFDLVGELVDPSSVLRGGGELHAVGDRGVRAGQLRVTSPDAALVSAGHRRLRRPGTPHSPSERGISWWCLYNNVWATNFPLWWGESMTWHFRVTPG